MIKKKYKFINWWNICWCINKCVSYDWNEIWMIDGDIVVGFFWCGLIEFCMYVFFLLDKNFFNCLCISYILIL